MTPVTLTAIVLLIAFHLHRRYYEEAWERSGGRHTRGQRSLGRAALRRKEWAKAIDHYELALSINPLHPDAWFSLGFCCLKTEQPKKALQVRFRSGLILWAPLLISVIAAVMLINVPRTLMLVECMSWLKCNASVLC